MIFLDTFRHRVLRLWCGVIDGRAPGRPARSGAGSPSLTLGILRDGRSGASHRLPNSAPRCGASLREAAGGVRHGQPCAQASSPPLAEPAQSLAGRPWSRQFAQRSRRRRGGLTLVELVVTISVAGIIGVPAGVILSEQLRAGLRARDAVVAMSLARAELERLDSLDSAPGADSNTNGFCHPDLTLTTTSPAPLDNYWAGYPYALTRIVQCQTGGSTCDSNCDSPSDANNGIKRIELRVTRTGQAEVLATLLSYRTKYVRFGL